MQSCLKPPGDSASCATRRGGITAWPDSSRRSSRWREDKSGLTAPRAPLTLFGMMKGLEFQDLRVPRAGRGGKEGAHRPEDAADAVQDCEGLLQALHDAQPDQEVLHDRYRALARKSHAGYQCHQLASTPACVSPTAYLYKAAAPLGTRTAWQGRCPLAAQHNDNAPLSRVSICIQQSQHCWFLCPGDLATAPTSMKLR